MKSKEAYIIFNRDDLKVSSNKSKESKTIKKKK